MTVAAVIEPAEVEVDAGGSVEVRIRVRNRGTLVDGFKPVVRGPLAPWATVQPDEIQLFPRTEGEATITFAPPRAPEPAAGAHDYEVHVQSVAQPESSTVETARLTVRPFVEFKAALANRVVERWRRGAHTLTIQNLGNAAARFMVEATDPEERLVLAVEPPALDVPPGGSGTATVRSVARRWLVVGPGQRLPFSIDVAEPTAGRQALPATFAQRAILPRWAIPLGGAALALIIALLVVPGIINGPDGSDAPTSAASASVSPSVPASPSPGPTDTPPPSASPTPTPTATIAPPTVGATSISIGGDVRVAGVHPATFAQAYRQGVSLIVELTYAVNGDTCVLQIVVDGGARSGRLEVDSEAKGAFGCQRSGIALALTSGSVGFTRTDANTRLDEVSASFSLTAGNPFPGPQLTLRGTFGDLRVTSS